MLGNTYHLHFRPGEELIAELGGLHAFMGWDGPILTDSGGFQVFSLRDTLLAADDDGVTFRSVYDGTPERFTPGARRARSRSGSAPTSRCASTSARPAGVPRAELEEAVRRTTLWARRQRDLPRAPGQLRFAITQGGLDGELRRRSSEELVRARLRRLRDRRPERGRGARADVRGDRRPPRRSCRWASRATSWASATRRACSR